MYAVYDYVELHPLENYEYLVEIGSSFDSDRIKTVIKDIIKVADKLNKPIIASAAIHITPILIRKLLVIFILWEKELWIKTSDVSNE